MKPTQDSGNALFESLREAKTAGYVVRCVAAGPRDMPHSGVFIYGPDGMHEYLVSKDASWDIKDARRAALALINERLNTQETK